MGPARDHPANRNAGHIARDRAAVIVPDGIAHHVA